MINPNRPEPWCNWRQKSELQRKKERKEEMRLLGQIYGRKNRNTLSVTIFRSVGCILEEEKSWKDIIIVFCSLGLTSFDGMKVLNTKSSIADVFICQQNWLLTSWLHQGSELHQMGNSYNNNKKHFLLLYILRAYKDFFLQLLINIYSQTVLNSPKSYICILLAERLKVTSWEHGWNLIYFAVGTVVAVFCRHRCRTHYHCLCCPHPHLHNMCICISYIAIFIFNQF